MSNGHFLDEWKVSYINPIFKSGDKKKVTNYRPISKLSTIPKLFDKIVKNKLYEIIKCHISNFQHGFISGRSTTTNLACFSHHCFNAVEKRSQMDVVYTDFVKAFSRVNHVILIKKLKLYGFDGSLLSWISSYLTGRKQIVKIGDLESESISVHSGVPEGSHLGPPLFVLFINDFPSVLSTAECLIFADDIKMFKIIKSYNDCVAFQQDIINFEVWCKQNDLDLNLSKCSVISYNHLLNPIIFDYFLKGFKLLRVHQVKDLGVVFDDKLNFSSHVSYIVSKANSMLGFLKRNSTDFKDPYTLKAIYCSLVRPLLEYCSVIWCPGTKKLIIRIENIQKNFLRFALRNFGTNAYVNLDYNSRCLLVGMQTLESRRRMFSVLFIRDILSNDINCDFLLSLINIYAPSRPLRTRNFIFENPHSTNYGQREPISHSCKFFNMYYQDLDIYLSRNQFKNSLIMLLHNNFS